MLSSLAEHTVELFESFKKELMPPDVMQQVKDKERSALEARTAYRKPKDGAHQTHVSEGVRCEIRGRLCGVIRSGWPSAPGERS